jgi:hypothetical protein
VFKTQRTPNSVVFLFRPGKELFSQDFQLVSGIINYNFGLSAFIFSKSGGQNSRFNMLPTGVAAWHSRMHGALTDFDKIPSLEY